MATGTGQPRTYTIATETANGTINQEMLEVEIAADAGITTALNYTGTAEGDLDIFFVATLSGAEITALDAVVLAHQGTTTISTWQKWEDNTVQSTTLETWQNALQRTAAAAIGGTYKLEWNFELRLASAGPLNSKAGGRFSSDSNFKGIFHVADEEWVGYSGWDFITLAEGDTPQLKLEFRRDPTIGGNDTAEIRRCKMSIELMGP